jgi:hypothetical protein
MLGLLLITTLPHTQTSTLAHVVYCTAPPEPTTHLLLLASNCLWLALACASVSLSPLPTHWQSLQDIPTIRPAAMRKNETMLAQKENQMLQLN